MERMYPNQFARIGVRDEEVLAKVNAAFQTSFAFWVTTLYIFEVFIGR